MTLCNFTCPQSLLVSVMSDFTLTCQIRYTNESTTGWNLKFNKKVGILDETEQKLVESLSSFILSYVKYMNYFQVSTLFLVVSFIWVSWKAVLTSGRFLF